MMWGFVLLVLFCGSCAAVADLELVDSMRVDDGSLQRVLEEKDLYLLVYAPFLGSCKEVVPLWNQVARVFKEHPQVNVAHLNVQESSGHRSLARFLEVCRFWPCMLFIKEGEVYPFPMAGMVIPKDPAEAAKHLEFVKGGYKSDAVKKKPLPPEKHTAFWFDSHDFTGLDGVVRPGPKY